MKTISFIMNRIPLIALSFFLLTISNLSAQESNQATYPLGVFNFDFARLGADEISQMSELQSIGYGGMTLRVNTEKQLEELKLYQEAIGDGPFKVYAGFITIFFDQDLAAQNAHLDNVIKALKKSDTKLWVILRVKGGQKVERKQIVDFLRSAAERTKAAGVELVIYPHWSGGNPRNVCLIESAEDAIPYLEEVQSDNLFVSLHLCHEIMAGNGDRLDEVAAKVKPWLRLPSINGADVDAVNEAKGWKRGIQPLTMGDYDSSRLLKTLKSVGYEGPVILHTYGLQKSAANHHHTSFKRFQEMVEKL
jgi:sugar phosphate isomerase/epimerase